MMKSLFLLLLMAIGFVSCQSYNTPQVINRDAEDNLAKTDTVSISSDDSDYEIIIIEPGFNAWLNGTARPRGFHSQEFLETRNALFVQQWNLRNSQPQVYSPDLYVLRIDYDPSVDYGYEINYKLYNYFIYFQLKYKQQLTSFIPRI